MNRRITAYFFVALFSAIIILPPSTHATNNSIYKQCKPIEAIFARGSGQKLEGEEYAQYNGKLIQYLQNTGIDSNTYELGTEHQRGSDGIGYKYPAVPVTDSLTGYANAVGAALTNGHGEAYGKSVEDGTKELALYLNQRFSDQGGSCRDSKIIIAGYSQGAQIVGQLFTYSPGWIAQSVRERVVYLALFGDPKLHLPEGQSTLFNGFTPSACQQHPVRSPWRMGVSNCRVYTGILGMRDPYLVDEFRLKSGLWCNDHDAICDSGRAVTDVAGHGEYVSSGGIEAGVKESLSYVAYNADAAARKKLLYSIRNNGKPDPRIDLSGYALPHKDKNLLNTESPADFWVPQPCVGYVVADRYKLYGSTPHFQIINTRALQLRSDIRETVEQLYWRGCDIEILKYDSLNRYNQYTLVLKATRDIPSLQTTIDTLPREFKYTYDYTDFLFDSCLPTINAIKEIDIRIVNEYIPPYGSDGYTTRYFIRDRPYACYGYHAFLDYSPLYRAMQTAHVDHAPQGPGDRRYVFPSQATYLDLARPRSGVHIRDSPPAASSQLLPGDFSITFLNTTYYGTPDTTLKFTIKPSNPAVSINEYASYAWDFDNNGTIDTRTDTPTVEHAYATAYTGKVRVVATNLDNQSFETTAEVQVSATVFDQFKQEATTKPAAPRSLSVRKTSADSVSISWEPADNLAAGWYIQINDTPGQRVKLTSTRNIAMQDIDTTRTIDITVRGISSQDFMGEAATVRLLASSSSGSASAPPSSLGRTRTSQNQANSMSSTSESTAWQQSISAPPAQTASAQKSSNLTTQPDPLRYAWVAVPIVAVMGSLATYILRVVKKH